MRNCDGFAEDDLNGNSDVIVPGRVRTGRIAKLTSLASNAAWVILFALALVIGIVSLRYGLPSVPYPVLKNFVTHRLALSIHAVFASIALLAGPLQFRKGLRARHLRLHRWMGRIYVGAVLVAWISSIPVALHAETGAIAAAGFLSLGFFWVTSTAVALSAILCHKVEVHRRWMLRSYALTSAGITLRIYLGIAAVLDVPFGLAYPTIAWICWIPNLLVIEIALLSVAIKRRKVAPAIYSLTS